MGKITRFSAALTQKISEFSLPLLHKLLEIQKVANDFDSVKADKVDNPGVDNIAILGADGNIKDSGKDITGTFLEDLSGLTTDDLPAGSVNLYFTGFTSLSADYGFTDNSINWDAAYGWGNHASAGYLTSESDPLAVLKAMFTADSQVLVGTGNGTYQAESGATLRTSLGLGIGDTPEFAGLDLTGDITAAGIKINAATDWFGSASVPDAPALTSNEFDDQTTGTASTSYVLRQYDGDWEDIDDNFSTVATEFNKLRADVSDLRLQVNDLLAQLRTTGGCGVIDD